MSRHLVRAVLFAVIVMGVASVASAEIWNVAAFKPTSQSSMGWNGVSGKAVNGVINDADFTHTADDDRSPFWLVDLGEEFLIDSISLYNRTNVCCGKRLYNVTVDVLDEADASVYTFSVFNPWDGVDPAVAPDPGLGPFAFDLSGQPGGGVTGSKVRVSKAPVAGDTGEYYLSLAEVEVMVDGPVNVALGAPVTATGPVYNNWDPNQITDGNLLTQVHSATGATTYAYEIDLGQTIDLENIDVWGRQDNCCADRLADYRISVHEDDNGGIGAEVWAAELAGQGSVLGAPDTFLAGDGVGTFSGQWIRIDRIDDTVPTNYVLQVAEVRAFAVPEPATLALLAMGGLILLPLWHRRRRAR